MTYLTSQYKKNTNIRVEIRGVTALKAASIIGKKKLLQNI